MSFNNSYKIEELNKILNEYSITFKIPDIYKIDTDSLLRSDCNINQVLFWIKQSKKWYFLFKIKIDFANLNKNFIEKELIALSKVNEYSQYFKEVLTEILIDNFNKISVQSRNLIIKNIENKYLQITIIKEYFNQIDKDFREKVINEILADKFRPIFCSTTGIFIINKYFDKLTQETRNSLVKGVIDHSSNIEIVSKILFSNIEFISDEIFNYGIEKISNQNYENILSKHLGVNFKRISKIKRENLLIRFSYKRKSIGNIVRILRNNFKNITEEIKITILKNIIINKTDQSSLFGLLFENFDSLPEVEREEIIYLLSQNYKYQEAIKSLIYQKSNNISNELKNKILKLNIHE